MNFKDCYQKEINAIKRTPGLTEMAFQKADLEKNNKLHLNTSWKLAAAVMAAVCIIGGVAYGDKAAGFAKSIWGSFALSADDEKMKLDPIKSVPFDQETFIADENTQMDKESQDASELYYSQTFSDYHTMQAITKLELPGADKIEYKNITLSIQPKSGYGQISAQIVYNDNPFDVNAMFAIDGFNQQEWGYGENQKIKEVYEYADDKKAYFIENDEIETVYFSEGNILFQLFIKKTTKARTEAKKMLAALAGQ